mmetsp:Transcript_29357/g.90839  ORF Transcript_29357/g.90839 Transcript_29357/m.90839 type:complete len:472 (+) Transcript_29357:1481-2896(+)
MATAKSARRQAIAGVDDMDEFRSHGWAQTPQSRQTTRAAREFARAHVTLLTSATGAGGAVSTDANLYLEDPTVYDRAKQSATYADPVRESARRALVAQVAGDYDYEGILRAELPGHDDRRGKLARQPTDGAKLVDASCQRRLARRELFRRLFAEMTDEERRVAWAEASLTTGYENLSEMALLQRALVNKRHVEAERAVHASEVARARRRDVNKARSARGATLSDLARVARSRDLVLSPDELKRVFSRLGPAARETPTVETLRGFFHAEAAGRGATRSLSEAEIRWVMAAVHALLEDEDVTIGDAIRAANRAAQRREEPVTGQRRWILVAKEWLDFESVPLDDFVATLDESSVCTSEADLDRCHAALAHGAPAVQRAYVAKFDFVTPLVDEIVGAEEALYFPLMDSALSAVLSEEEKPTTLFDERRYIRDTDYAGETSAAVRRSSSFSVDKEKSVELAEIEEEPCCATTSWY